MRPELIGCGGMRVVIIDLFDLVDSMTISHPDGQHMHSATPPATCHSHRRYCGLAKLLGVTVDLPSW